MPAVTLLGVGRVHCVLSGQPTHPLMALAPRYSCPTCHRDFTNDSLIKDEDKFISCMFCDTFLRFRAAIRHNSEVLESLDNRFKSWESGAGLITVKAVHIEDKEAVLTIRGDNLESRMVSTESKVDDRGTFQPARKTWQPKVGAQIREVPTQNRFSVLRDEVQEDPSTVPSWLETP